MPTQAVRKQTPKNRRYIQVQKQESASTIIDVRQHIYARLDGQMSLFEKRDTSTSVSASDIAFSRVQQLGRITPEDSKEMRRKKLDAAFALSDALADEGVIELWSESRIDLEIAKMRRHAL